MGWRLGPAGGRPMGRRSDSGDIFKVQPRAFAYRLDVVGDRGRGTKGAIKDVQGSWEDPESQHLGSSSNRPCRADAKRSVNTTSYQHRRSPTSCVSWLLWQPGGMMQRAYPRAQLVERGPLLLPDGIPTWVTLRHHRVSPLSSGKGARSPSLPSNPAPLAQSGRSCDLWILVRMDSVSGHSCP